MPGRLLMTPALILGGYGTFGAHVAQTLAQRNVPLTIAGRDGGRAAAGRDPARPKAARVTLFIGNDNPKGAAAMGTFLAGLARPIAAPQGRLRGYRDRAVVPLPPPFGPRGVFNFDGPEYDLFPELL